MLQLDISPRQTGKTLRMIQDMIDYLWEFEDKTIAVVSPCSMTSNFITEMVICGFGERYKRSGRFITDSEVGIMLDRLIKPRIKKVTLHENLRGWGYNKIYVDEYSYVSNSLLCDMIIHNSLADFYINGVDYHQNSEMHLRLLRDDSLPDNYFDKLTPKPFDLQKLKFI